MRLLSHSVHRDFVQFFVGNENDNDTFDAVYYKISEGEVVCTCKKEFCEHANFVHKYFEKMNISQIASLLESNLKSSPPEVSYLRLARMMANALFNCQQNSGNKSINTINTWWGNLDNGKKARVFETESMRTYRVYVDIKNPDESKPIPEIVRVSENGYITSCTCPDSSGSRPCDHLDAYTKAVDFWTGEDEYIKRLAAREVTNVPPPTLPPATTYLTSQISKLTPNLNEAIRDQMKKAAEEIEEAVKTSSILGTVSDVRISAVENVPYGMPIYLRESDGRFVTTDGTAIGGINSPSDISKINYIGVYKEEKPEEPKEPPKPKTRFENFEL